MVAIDGYGAAGKTTIASEVAVIAGRGLVHTDDYFRTRFRPTTRAPMARYYDWARAAQRSAPEPAIGGGGR